MRAAMAARSVSARDPNRALFPSRSTIARCSMGSRSPWRGLVPIMQARQAACRARKAENPYPIRRSPNAWVTFRGFQALTSLGARSFLMEALGLPSRNVNLALRLEKLEQDSRFSPTLHLGAGDSI